MTALRLGLLGAALALAGCEQSYQVTVTNLSHNQPLAPVAMVVHDDSYQAWQIGQPASSGLERLAEGGDNIALIGEAALANSFASASSAGVIGPGQSETVELNVATKKGLRLTLASMLVNTNDAFAGLNRWHLASLKPGASITLSMPVYDAGTEANLEQTGTIPGPADGGEGYNAERDDVNYVARHPGVVSMDDGYTESVLDQSHRFDGPVAQVTIERRF